ncbi:MAG: c-type cytochrome [Thermodesulfobacteriota bacterium]
MKIILTVILMIILAVAGLFVFINSGFYNVAALKPHTKFTHWILNTTIEKSVRRHAAGIKSPPLSDDSLVQSGFDHYNEMCVGCHGKPGLPPSELENGFNPEPPDLVERIKEGKWKAEELFWITKHGIKMSAMPAFGPTHSDEEVWTIVAFLKHLPDLSPEEYKAMEKASEGKNHRSHEQEQEHEHSH